MKERELRCWLTIAGLTACGLGAMNAQDSRGGPARSDPRVGLRAGVRDAGQASRHLELVASLPKPVGFVNPESPLGDPTPPEPRDGQPRPRPAFDPKIANRLDFTNSDLAFDKQRLVMGSFHGFNVYDIEESQDPKLLASIVCPGGQGDVSVFRHLLFMSVEQGRGRLDCGTQGHQTAVSAERFRGVRIFDITDVTKPRQVAAVQTCRGSHTHTLVPDPRDPTSIYVYGSGTAPVRAAEELAGCSGADPKDDPDTALFSIDVIKVPLARPEEARIINRPRIFADPATGNIAGLWLGGTHGEGSQRTSATNQCHDITVFPELAIAAGACSGNGILLDISDPERPTRLDQVVDRNFAYWHSAMFNNDGTKVIFTDEWGGGRRPRCRATDPPTWGADAIFDIVDRKLKFASYFKMPAAQTDLENCVAHNGSLIPVPGRDIMAQAWYQGGISVFDFTDSARPVEIAFFDRGPLDPRQLYTGGYWAAYWFNGRIYASEMARGLDVFRLKPSEFLTQNEIAAATLVHADTFNPQVHSRVTWPATALVGRAYLDQLQRSRAIAADRARTIRRALEQGEGLAPGSARASTVGRQLETLADELEPSGATASSADRATASSADRATASSADRLRFRALAALLRARAAALR
jgi:hypothetical protein